MLVDIEKPMLLRIENETSRVFEKINTYEYSDAKEASIVIANEIAELIKKKQSTGEYCVLGLATGNSPKHVYAELVRKHREEGLSFSNVVSFNLDEYYPMEKDALQSYVRFMKEQLFDHIDIEPQNYNIPDGTLSKDEISAYCEHYEEKIKNLGGIDIQLLGIGHNGHIGFNESGSSVNSKTRLVALDHSTRTAAAGDFFGLSNTPRKAITMGVRQIMQAKRIILMAWGEAKGNIVKEAVEGKVTEQVPASYLQNHSDVAFVLDEGTSLQLTRVNKPWLVDSINWDADMVRRAVVGLAREIQKPLLKLTDDDYNVHGLGDLAAEHGPAYNINIRVFNDIQHTITGWPGGKPNADDTNRPERAEPGKKRVIIFSPHPDDDIISMGGTFIRLADQGHEVHVGYQTSGNIAVSDEEAVRFMEFVSDYNQKFGIDNGEASKMFDEAVAFCTNKKASEKDTEIVRRVKGLIRRGEAQATCRFVGLPDHHAHFLNMPFYETGLVQKNPIGPEDVQIIADLIAEIKPHQIYAAGDLADPHGTHKVCLDAIFAALEQLKNEDYMQDCWVWLYRGAWAEWDIDQIEMAVPMSPEEVLKKRYGIFKHQSQKDGVVFQGADSREFWQRAEDRNGETAEIYKQLGMAEYEAMEAFRRYHFLDK